MHPYFEKNGYLIARNFFDETTIALAQTYFNLKHRIINYSDENRAQADSSTLIDITSNERKARDDIAISFNFYSDHLVESIHLNYGQKACSLLDMTLSPTYTYTRIYEKTNPLLPHIDRPSCEVSITCPVLLSDDRPSTIYISNYKVNSNDNSMPIISTYEEVEKRGDYTEVNLYPGDALFYRGCDRYHWRKPLESDYLIQFFLHFVDADGQYKDWCFDKRPYSGFPNSYKMV